jgi:hypothetical protein
MSGRASLGVYEIGGLKLRGNVTSFQPGGVDRPHEANADESVDYHETNIPMTITIELSYVPDVDLKKIQDIKEKDGTLSFSNNIKYRTPKATFSTKGELSAEGKISVTFMGPKASRL